jgi:hypothetical protein
MVISLLLLETMAVYPAHRACCSDSALWSLYCAVFSNCGNGRPLACDFLSEARVIVSSHPRQVRPPGYLMVGEGAVSDRPTVYVVMF